MATTVKVAIVGCGTVGGATAGHLLGNADLIRERYALDLRLAAVVDKRLDHAREIGLPEEILGDDLESILARDDIGIVVELVGGIDVAFAIIKRALEAGKHVVTANKALLAHRGEELYAAAHKAGVALAFEASCGGGIPLIRSITEGLAGNRVDAIYGIVNGTCNYILSEMIARSVSYDEALAQAQHDGLAEADPTLDVGGFDSAHKIAVLASLAFGITVDYDQIPVEGIDTLDVLDVSWGRRLGYVAKLLAIAERSATGVTFRVRPCFVHTGHPLAWVSGPFNAISVYSYPTGHTMYYGRGAGGSATSGAIVADIISVASGAYPELFEKGLFWPDRTEPVTQNAPGTIHGRYYVRAIVEDLPGVLAEMAARFGAHGISIASVHQDEIAEGGGRVAPVVVVTHRASEDALRAAVAEIDAMPHVSEPCAVISIIDEPNETLIDH
ncbi:MAG: homoserine dehydrogenase [Spirochaetota bacterium]